MENTNIPDAAASKTALATAREFSDFREAARSVAPEQKRRAWTLLAAGGATLAVLFLSRLIWLFKPLFDLVYYAAISTILYYIALIVLFTVFVVLLDRYLKKHCALKLFAPKKNTVSIPQTLGVVALGAVTVFIISAAFKFKVKIEIEMGRGVTMATALTNLAVYVYYGLHLWLGLIAAALVQDGMDVLLPSRYSLPWGALTLIAVFGPIELILELFATAHLYPWMYYILTFVYAAVYELTGRSFHLTYWACVIIMVL